MKIPKLVFLIVIPLIYFFIVWFFPWNKLEFHPHFSVIYCFDLSFVLVISIVLKKIPEWRVKNFRSLVMYCLVIIPVSAIIIWINNSLNLHSPFKYVTDVGVQLLILAPIIEELVFRHGFYSLGKHFHLSEKMQVHYNSILFSVSHLASIWVLPPKFFPFIAYQVAYTFLLGRICTKSLIAQKSIFAPILLHFFFNLVFYYAVTSRLIT